MSINLKNSFKNNVALPLTMVLSIAASPVVMAENPASATQHSASSSSVSYSAPTQKKTPAQLMRDAGNYSKENNGIGMFINIAPDTKYTPQQVGDALVRKFKKDGIKSAYTFNYAKAGDSSVDFFVRGIPYTDYGLDKVKEAYALVSKTFHALEAKDLASNDLAYNHD